MTLKKFVFDKVIYLMAGKQRTEELQHATYKMKTMSQISVITCKIWMWSYTHWNSMLICHNVVFNKSFTTGVLLKHLSYFMPLHDWGYVGLSFNDYRGKKGLEESLSNKFSIHCPSLSSQDFFLVFLNFFSSVSMTQVHFNYKIYPIISQSS